MRVANDTREPHSPTAAGVSPSMLPEEELHDAETNIYSFLKVFRTKVKSLSYAQLIFILVLMGFMMAGTAIQIIGINFWLRSFPGGGHSGSYTILTLSGLIFATIFTVILVTYVLYYKPDLHFASDHRGWIILAGAGTMDAFNSFMNIYAANHTPEVMQALFQSLMPIFTCILTQLVLYDPRNYKNRWVYLSFGLTIFGVGIAVIPDLLATGEKGDDTAAIEPVDAATSAPPRKSRGDTLLWCLIYSLSVPLTSLMNVWQTKYMEDYTITAEDIAKEEEAAALMRRSAASSLRRQREGGGSDGGAPQPFATAMVEMEEKKGLLGADDDDAEEEKEGGGGGGGHGSRQSTNSARAKRSGLDALKGIVTARAQKANNSSSEKSKQNSHVPNATTTTTVSSSATYTTTIVHTAAGVQYYYRSNVRPFKGEDTIVKLTMLFGDTTIQAFISLLLLPADALPWWGGSASVSEAADHFNSNLDFIFTDRTNLMCALFYSSGFLFTYIGGAYLNQYSPTLCSMVGQLSSPMTALMLILVPSWNLEASHASWYWSAIAVAALMSAAVVYAVWEELTAQEMAYGRAHEEERKDQLRAMAVGVAAAAAIDHDESHHNATAPTVAGS